MVAALEKWVLQIITFVLLIVLLELILPTGKMRKAVGLVSGMILILTIISPIISFLGKGLDLTAFQIMEENALDKERIIADSRMLEKVQVEQTIEVYRQKLISQLEQETAGIEGVQSVKADIIINEDVQAESFGMIRRIYLEVVEKGMEAEEKSVSSEKIGIRKIELGSKKATQSLSTDLDATIVKEIKARISKEFSIGGESIIVTGKRGGSNEVH